jgi:hypothetical protein
MILRRGERKGERRKNGMRSRGGGEGRASFLNGENDLVLVTVTTRSKNKQRNHASGDISQTILFLDVTMPRVVTNFEFTMVRAEI